MKAIENTMSCKLRTTYPSLQTRGRWDDYGARFYDPMLGRFHSVDAYAEDFYDYSPYCYVENNPIVYVDPDGNFKTKFGAWIYKVFNGGGDIKWSNDQGEYFVGKQTEYKGEGIGASYKRTFSFNSDKKTGDALNKVDAGLDFAYDFAASGKDFVENYKDMRDANWVNSDKYFHSKANYEASKRGPCGEFFATHFSNLREITDQRIKGDSRKDSEDDQEANRYGQKEGKKDRKKKGRANYKKAIPK